MGAALFAGLCTLDVIQYVERMPGPDEKVASLRQVVAAGGPATNAAVACSALGGSVTLLTGIGDHPLAAGIRADLDAFDLRVVDLGSGWTGPPTLSSIMVTAGTGERAVVSTNAAGRELRAPADVGSLVRNAAVVEVDGHFPALARATLEQAARAGRLAVLDGGSWKPGTEQLLPLLDVAVCSADFHPPGVSGPHETLEFLLAKGVRYAAVSRGSGSIVWRGPSGGGEVPVPEVRVADTLGAGDVLHGALVHALAEDAALTAERFERALSWAARIATHSCRSFGTRVWTREPLPGDASS